MPKRKNSDINVRLAELEKAYRMGVISKETYQAALSGLKSDPLVEFQQEQQHVEQQINIGKGIFPTTSKSDASPEALRRAYLNRLSQQSFRLRLAGIDPKAAGDEGSRELHLSAVYTALMTQRAETENDRRHLRTERKLDGESRRLSALEVLNKEQWLALLGDPGSGKSTFINFVGLCLAGETLDDPAVNLTMMTSPLPEGGKEDAFEDEEKSKPQPWYHGVLLPVRIELRDFAA